MAVKEQSPEIHRKDAKNAKMKFYAAKIHFTPRSSRRARRPIPQDVADSSPREGCVFAGGVMD
jgi:hypothetical protein